MGAYDAECAAIARALETAARRCRRLDLTIFTDAQTAIWRMTSDDPGPGQTYAIAAREYIAEVRCKKPEISIEIRRCPGHCGIEGNAEADGPDPHGVEWFSYRCM